MTMTIISICSPSYDYLELAAEANNVQLSCALTLSCKRANVSCQLIGSKSNPTFSPVKFLIDHTVALIQQVDNVEQYNDV